MDLRSVPRISSLAGAVTAALVLCACPAPVARTVDVTFELGGADQVSVHAAFADLRLQHDDPLLGFREIALLASPSRAARALQLPELERASSYRFTERDGRLDLEIEGALARVDFERCVTACSPAEKGRCEWLPIRRCGGGGYELRVTDLVNVYAFAPGAIERWPSSSTSLRYALVSRKGRNDGPSALQAWRQYQEDPGQSARLADWMDASDAAFSAWSEPASVEVISSPPAGLPAGLAALEQTYLFRKRCRLLFEALIDSHVEVQPPPEADLQPRLGQRIPLLGKPLPRAAARRLTEAYRAVQKDPKRSAELFGKACPRKLPKRGELRALCAMLQGR